MKYHKLTENAVKPEGFWGKLMIRSMNKGHSDMTDWALDYIKFENGFRVLDVGCGGGKTVAKLCGKVGSGKVYGIDYSDIRKTCCAARRISARRACPSFRSRTKALTS